MIAYGLGELWTFVPTLADALGSPWDIDNVPNAHVVATIAVYFNPAKSYGAMIEADMLIIVGVAYAMLLCCGSMAMSVVLDRHNLQALGHILVVTVWLGAGYGYLAWIKLTSGKAAVGTACSMVSLICSGLITKTAAFHIGQFQVHPILQILLIVLIGSLISNFVCFAIWPRSAVDQLQVDLNRTLSSFSTLLDLLCKTFMLEGGIRIRPESLQRAIDTHHASFTTLKNDLEQAKFEILDSRISATGHVYDEIVDTMLRLSQGLNGMRSACSLQQDLMQADLDGFKGTEAEKMRYRDEIAVLRKFDQLVGPSLRDLRVRRLRDTRDCPLTMLPLYLAM